LAIPLAIGFINGFRAFALMIGPLFISKYVTTKSLHIFLTLQGVFIIIWSFIQKDFYLSLGWMFFLGFLTTTLWSFTYTLIQTHTKKEYLGRIVAYNDMLFLSTAAFTSFMTGFLAEKEMSLEGITILLGIGFFIGGIYFAWIIKYKNIQEIEQ